MSVSVRDRGNWSFKTALGSVAGAIMCSGIVCLLFLVVFGGFISKTPYGQLSSVIKDAITILNEPKIQWIIFLLIQFYSIGFLCLRNRKSPARRQLCISILWLSILSAININICISDSPLRLEPILFLAYAVIGQGVSLWALSQVMNRCLIVLLSLITLIVLASILSVKYYAFTYNGLVRLSGPWNSPNVFGLMEGVGMGLVLGLAIIKLRVGTNHSKLKSYGLFAKILYIIAAISLLRGLLYSYSRGAWIGMILGAAYLCAAAVPLIHATKTLQKLETSKVRYMWAKHVHLLKKNRLALYTISFSLLVLSFWPLAYSTHGAMTNRFLSMANENDFSWRNRILGWKGALQIMAEHPWFGAGWQGPELLYAQYYFDPKLDDNGAVTTNDYFMFGAILGVPALFCLGMYLWLSLNMRTDLRGQNLNEIQFDWLKTTCRAGAIVLAVGFWFDGGLFNLPTASTFWILLELGRRDTQRIAYKTGVDFA